MSSPCPFCEIDEAECIFFDEHVMAFYDRYPVTPGHTLVVSRRHIEDYFGASDAEKNALWQAVEAVKTRLEASHNADGFNVGFNAGQAAGQTVMHLHIHVIPRREGDMDDPRGGIRGVLPHKQKY